MREKIKTLLMTGAISSLITALKRKRLSVNKFVLQIEEIPIYITYVKESKSTSKLILEDVGNKNKKILRINFDNNIEHLLFLLSLIRDEYKRNTLFTNKSQL